MRRSTASSPGCAAGNMPAVDPGRGAVLLVWGGLFSWWAPHRFFPWMFFPLLIAVLILVVALSQRRRRRPDLPPDRFRTAIGSARDASRPYSNRRRMQRHAAVHQ